MKSPEFMTVRSRSLSPLRQPMDALTKLSWPSWQNFSRFSGHTLHLSPAQPIEQKLCVSPQRVRLKFRPRSPDFSSYDFADYFSITFAVGAMIIVSPVSAVTVTPCRDTVASATDSPVLPSR